MIAIIDYGLGNLESVKKSLSVAGAAAVITNKHYEIVKADKIVLPGQGAFADGIKNLSQAGLIPILNKQILEKHKPFLGICLGLQLLGETSFENGKHQGLNWIRGIVIKLKVGKGEKLPHIGWDNVSSSRPPLFSQISDGSDFYFVHSYYLKPEDQKIIAATCAYGEKFPVAFVQKNIWATLFHPEKSQQSGLQLLKNFVNLA